MKFCKYLFLYLWKYLINHIDIPESFNFNHLIL